MRHYKTITWTNRLQIEAMLRVKTPVAEIARLLGFNESSIYREIKRGQYEHLNSDYTTELRYSPEKSEQKKQAYLREKGRSLKIGKDFAFARFVEYKISKEKYSPAAVLGEIKRKGLEFDTHISEQTLYRYIEQGVFLTLTNKDLPVKRFKTGKYKKVRSTSAAKPPKGESIEKRPEVVDSRETFGHWEMDCVCGKQGTTAALLVFTERKTRYEIIRKLEDKTTESVVKAINFLESKFGERFKNIFQSITCDNGSEFQDCAGMEKSINDGKRTQFFYCHPYSSFERGSNENQNKMIRRHFPKGYDFTDTTQREANKVEHWLNEYPREMFDYYSSSDLFEACVNSAA